MATTYNPVPNFRKAQRGTAGSTLMAGAVKASINSNEAFKLARSPYPLPRRNFRVGAEADIVVDTESFDDYLEHLSATGIEILKIFYRDGAADKFIQPHVEVNGAEQFDVPDREGGKVAMYRLKFKVVGLQDTSTIATELAPQNG